MYLGDRYCGMPYDTLYVTVEGQSERKFVEDVLVRVADERAAEHLAVRWPDTAQPEKKSRYSFPSKSRILSPFPFTKQRGWRLYVGRTNSS